MSKNEKKKFTKKQTIKNNQSSDIVKTFDRLYELSQNGYKFINLMDIIQSENNIRLAFETLKKAKGSLISGVDKKTIEDFKNLTIEQIVNIVRNKLNNYNPKPIFRMEIPKPGLDKSRPIGISCFIDRLVQQAIKQVMEPIAEAQFYPYSYGFRPNCKVEHAIARCYSLIQQTKLHYVVNFEIKEFFDNVNHHKLMQQLWNMGFQDKNLLSLIKKMLKAPVRLSDGKLEFPNNGILTTGILNTLLANIYLNELDWWIGSQFESFPAKKAKVFIKKNGAIDKAPVYRVLRKTKLKEIQIVRYGDEFKIFTRTFEEAKKLIFALQDWFISRLKINVDNENIKIINLKKKYTDFLGFKFKVWKKGTKYVVKSRMSDQALKLETEKLIKQIKIIQNLSGDKLVCGINIYNSMVIGIHNYYDIATHISKDMAIIGRRLDTVIKNRLLRKSKNSKKGKLDPNSYLNKYYGNSKQIRFYSKRPIIPVGYCKHSYPLCKKRGENIYSSTGRELLQKNKKIDLSILKSLMEIEPNEKHSIEFLDNRVSLYCSQHGRCGITGIYLNPNEIHCHHKIPLSMGGDDSYDNLIIVHKDIHRLIHATLSDTIQKYFIYIKDEKMLKKLNKLRKLAGNKELSSVMLIKTT